MPIDLKQFAEKKLDLKKKCSTLIELGKKHRDKFKTKPNQFRERRFVNKYKKLVLDLEQEMALLNLCYKKNDINPLIPWIQVSSCFDRRPAFLWKLSPFAAAAFWGNICGYLDLVVVVPIDVRNFPLRERCLIFSSH